nr:basic secretory protein-like protein [uncultured Undibacterium sp.]
MSLASHISWAAALQTNAQTVRGKLTLTHVSASQWRADYEFDKAIDGLRFRKIGEYREQAWKPGANLIVAAQNKDKDGDEESYLSTSGSTTRFSFFIRPYGQFVEGEYAPINQFTDGGAAIYMGFFLPEASLNQQKTDISLEIQYQGLNNETVLAPAKRSKAEDAAQAYAYFGPQQVSNAGAMQIVLDPAMPNWMRDMLLSTSAIVSSYFERAYHRPLLTPLLMTVALTDLESNGLSIKGGASHGQINFRISGKKAIIESPALRDAFNQLIAHEIAHIWQNNLPHEAIGEEAAWIHEGGAEAMSLDALLSSGVWDKDKFNAMQTKRWNECVSLTKSGTDLATNYRAHYVCGMKRFDDTKLNIVTIWRALLNESERSGKVYSEQMVREIVEQLQKR